MTRKQISPEKLSVQAHDIWHNAWPLLTTGDFTKKDFNTMTVGWGSIGTNWNLPFVQVFVRHHRYTFEFMEKYDSFTISVLPQEYKKALSLLGTKSGRDGDKIAKAGLTPITSGMVSSPGFAEADLIIECKIIYWDDIEPKHFKSASIEKHYPQKDYHRVYFGEILAIHGKEKYQA